MSGELHIAPDGRDALLGRLRIGKLGINLHKANVDMKIYHNIRQLIPLYR